MSWDERKAKLAMLYVASKQNWQIDMYQLLKTIYFADKIHLQKWGEFITNDTYEQWKCGPVPIEMYRLVKKIERPGCIIDPRDLVTDKTKSGLTVKQVKYELSESEIEALDQAYEIFKGRDFNGIKIIAHEVEYPKHEQISIEALAEGDEELIAHVHYQEEYKMALGL